MEQYYATVQYLEETELTNVELNALRSFADTNNGLAYEVLTNQNARLIAFAFDKEEDANRFADASKNLEKIVEVKVGKLRRFR